LAPAAPAAEVVPVRGVLAPLAIDDCVVIGVLAPELSVDGVPLLQPMAPASSTAWPIAKLAAVLGWSFPLLIFSCPEVRGLDVPSAWITRSARLAHVYAHRE